MLASCYSFVHFVIIVEGVSQTLGSSCKMSVSCINFVKPELFTWIVSEQQSVLYPLHVFD